MTALATPPPPVTRPRPGDEARSLTVFANLLPDEVVNARRLRALQRNIVLALAGLIVLLIGVYAVSWWQTETARSDLTDQNQRTTVLQQHLGDFGPLLAAQAKVATVGTTLATLMHTDLSWRDLITRIEKQAPAGVAVTGVSGSVADPAAASSSGGASSGLALLNDSGKDVVGTLTISGSANDKRSLASFVDGLASVRGITVPLPASVTGLKDSLTYSINALITVDALGGRFTSSTTGGK